MSKVTPERVALMAAEQKAKDYETVANLMAEIHLRIKVPVGTDSEGHIIMAEVEMKGGNVQPEHFANLAKSLFVAADSLKKAEASE